MTYLCRMGRLTPPTHSLGASSLFLRRYKTAGMHYEFHRLTELQSFVAVEFCRRPTAVTGSAAVITPNLVNRKQAGRSILGRTLDSRHHSSSVRVSDLSLIHI